MSSLSNKIINLRADAQRFGWPRSVTKRAAKFAARYLGIHIHVVRVTEMRPDLERVSTMPSLDYRVVTPNELRIACVDKDMDLTREFVERAMARGDIAFGAFDGSKLVSYLWRSTTAAPHGDLWVRVDEPYCYAYKSFTLPSHRGKRISPDIHLFSDQIMLDHGYQYRAGFVEFSNWASLAMSKHMRSRYVGYAGYAKWFGRNIPFRTKGVKAIGFEFFQAEKRLSG